MSYDDEPMPAGYEEYSAPTEPAFEAPPQPAAPAVVSEPAALTRTAVLDPSMSTLTVSVEMKRATEFSKEAHSIATHLKVALPDIAVRVGENGLELTPGFQRAIDDISRKLLNVGETVVARQHGLSVQSGDDAVARVVGLFPGAQTVPGRAQPARAQAPAPAQVPGPFTAPAAAPAGGGVPMPTSAAPAANGRVNWKDLPEDQKQALASKVNGWVQMGCPDMKGIYNDLNNGSQYPKVKIDGVAIWGSVLLGYPGFDEATKAYARQCGITESR